MANRQPNIAKHGEMLRFVNAAESTLIMYDAGLGLLTDSLAVSVQDIARADGDKTRAYGRVCGGPAGSRSASKCV